MKQETSPPLAELHKQRAKAAAAESRAKMKLDEAKRATDAIEALILTELRAQREQGLASKAIMKDGTTYSEGDRRPWEPIDKTREEDVKAELIRLELTEFLGKTKYGELKSSYETPAELPGKLKDLVVQGHAYYLSVTKGKG